MQGDPNREEEGYIEELLSEGSPRPAHSQHSQSHARNPHNQQEGQNPLNHHGGRNSHNHQEAPLNIDLTNFDPRQVEFLLNVAANLQPQTKVEVPQRTKAKREKSVEDEAHSGANFVPRREKPTRSVFSRLGSSQETRHPRYGGDHHDDATWKDKILPRIDKRPSMMKSTKY